MSVNKIIGILLIIGSLALGYQGVNKIAESDASVEILDVDINLENKSQKEQGYIYLGLAVLLFGGGLYSLRKSTN